MLPTFADRVIAFNRSLEFNGPLPLGIGIMNPFRENEQILPVSSVFYRKYYSDNRPRHLILGINPGRFGAGVTGIPFTDTKRLKDPCGIDYAGKSTHEPSSVFVYEVIEAYGGPVAFYGDFYINSVFPLGFISRDGAGKEKNYNYYDSKELTAAVYDFGVESLRQQLSMGIETDRCYCFGTGKNEKFIRALNEKYHFFKEIIALEHPRFVMQYKSKFKQEYIDKYLQAFGRIGLSGI
ncbi:MAG: DUF4918 family protein [Prolixibacteraceae bacterium]|jgi:hypothetical protein|nr:DUF4918 family protein [Prolixibacteraceae bacterium]